MREATKGQESIEGKIKLSALGKKIKIRLVVNGSNTIIINELKYSNSSANSQSWLRGVA